ncbi:pyridoxamine 5'-phosphate oxidase family protein [Ornithinimicrobium sp. LYQ103]|uniref:pyridoxamine 5'-phosphate oxidase family protein n=1 Tax=Ornithinimicrobium sp. LYQ103 TaxID=3378796 RepID=UPI0038547704
MADWAEIEDRAPDIAAAGRLLFFYPGFGFGYFATVRRDGGPRVHPVNPLIFGPTLGLFVVPSPKLADLRRDGRFALHSVGAETVNDEFYVTGTAREVPDGDRRGAAVSAYHGPVAVDHVLFELDIERVLWARYADPPAWPPHYRHWTARSSAGAE